MKNKYMLVLALVIAASMLLSACQPQTIIQTVEVQVTKEVQVTVPVVETQLVEKTSVVEVEKGAFTTPDPITSDLKVRQAMDYCTNRVDLVKAGYPLISDEDAAKLVMATFIPKDHWAYAGDANVTIYPFDAAKGQALLEEDGWKIPEGGTVRQKDTTVLAMKFYTTTAAFRQAWAAVWEKQMADCGIQILRSHVPSSWWFGDTTGLQVRDFQLGAYAWVGQVDPTGQTLYACDSIPLPSNNWSGQNYMGWCNKTMDEAIKNANNTLAKEDRIKWYTIAQQEFTKDVPSIPLFNRVDTYAVNAKMTGFDPKPGEEYYTYNVADWEIPGRDTIVIGVTQEPAGLDTLTQSGFSAVAAASLLGFPRPDTHLNYDFQPLYYTKMPTIENGLAQNNDVDVKGGDKVYDASGNPGELKAGVKIKDNTGADVEFADGSTVKMKQLVVKYEFIPDLKWQDGSPLTQADFELGYKRACDKESGAVSYITCDQVSKVDFSGLSYTVTYLPGVQIPLYFELPFGFLPSKQPIETEGAYKGKTLGDVPPKDMRTLKEIAENPWSFGPYIITGWVKGQQLTYEVNPNYYGTPPKTKKIVLKIVTPENAEAQLITGEVDLLDSTTLTALSDQLVKAETDGKIKNVLVTSATWEHIDINLFLK